MTTITVKGEKGKAISKGLIAVINSIVKLKDVKWIVKGIHIDPLIIEGKEGA